MGCSPPIILLLQKLKLMLYCSHVETWRSSPWDHENSSRRRERAERSRLLEEQSSESSPSVVFLLQLRYYSVRITTYIMNIN